MLKIPGGCSAPHLPHRFKPSNNPTKATPHHRWSHDWNSEITDSHMSGCSSRICH